MGIFKKNTTTQISKFKTVRYVQLSTGLYSPNKKISVFTQIFIYISLFFGKIKSFNIFRTIFLFAFFLGIELLKNECIKFNEVF